MKKILAEIKKEDLLDLTALMSNYQTFITLKSINRDSIIDEEKLLEKISQVQIEIEDCKDKLLEKYNVPYYISQKMYIDIHNKVVYIDT